MVRRKSDLVRTFFHMDDSFGFIQFSGVATSKYLYMGILQGGVLISCLAVVV